jgi:hypothetical protein
MQRARYGRTPAGVILAGLVDRSVGYEQALVDARAQTRLGDGSIDIDVQGALVSPFTGAGIERLAIRATWLRNATARTRLDVGGVALAYGTEGLARI